MGTLDSVWSQWALRFPGPQNSTHIGTLDNQLQVFPNPSSLLFYFESVFGQVVQATREPELHLPWCASFGVTGTSYRSLISSQCPRAFAHCQKLSHAVLPSHQVLLPHGNLPLRCAPCCGCFGLPLAPSKTQGPKLPQFPLYPPSAAKVSLRSSLSMKPSRFWSMIVKA